MTDSNPTAALPGPVAEYVRACNAFDADALSAAFAEDAHYFNVADGHLTLLIITRNDPTPAWGRS